MIQGITLLIETSTERSSVGLFNEGKLIYKKDLSPGYQQSQELFPSISAGFKDCGISAKDLSHIFVGVGPGSYTGIRVGVDGC